MAHDVFICHSTQDEETARRVCERLEETGTTCWIAPRDVLGGTSYPDELVDAIHASRVLVLILSANADVSRHVRRELETAMQEGIAILPFRIEAHAPSKTMRYFLGSQQWVDATEATPEVGEKRLAEHVALLLERMGPRSEPDRQTGSPCPPKSASTASPSVPGTRVARRIEAFYLQAEACEAQGDNAGAIRAYESIQVLDPDDREAPRLLELARRAGGVPDLPVPTRADPTPREPGIVTVAPEGSPGLGEVLAAAKAGQTVRLLAGIHRLEHGATINVPLAIVGEGRDTTFVVCEDEEHVLHYSGQGQFSLSDVTLEHRGDKHADVLRLTDGVVQVARCGFTGAVQDENRGGGDGIWVAGGTRGAIVECSARGNEDAGVCMEQSSKVDVERCVVEQCWVGIEVDDQCAARLLRNSCHDNDYGIFVSGESGARVQDNDCSRNRRSGLVVMGTSPAVVRENRFLRNGWEGIRIGGKSCPQVDSNECGENGIRGILVQEEAAPSLVANHCSQNGKDGIEIQDDSKGLASRNRCAGNKDCGIGVFDRATPTLEANVCEDNVGPGIGFADDATGACDGNSCLDNQDSGIVLRDRSHPQVTNNHCSGNGRDGISYFDTVGGKCEGNRCEKSGEDGIYVDPMVEVMLGANRCVGNGGEAINDQR